MMSRWDDRFSAEHYVFGTAPNAFLERTAHHLPEGGRVLALADGEGRNGVFLAEQGHAVTSVDASPVGLEKAQRLAAERGVTLETVEADLATWDWPQGSFDGVVGVFMQFVGPELRAKFFAGMEAALAPGGVLILQGYRPEQLEYRTGGPPQAENMYTRELLEESFAGLEILQLDSYDAEIKEGTGHDGMSALIGLVARKPG